MMDFFFRGMQLYCTGLRSTARMFECTVDFSFKKFGREDRRREFWIRKN